MCVVSVSFCFLVTPSLSLPSPPNDADSNNVAPSPFFDSRRHRFQMASVWEPCLVTRKFQYRWFPLWCLVLSMGTEHCAISSLMSIDLWGTQYWPNGGSFCANIWLEHDLMPSYLQMVSAKHQKFCGRLFFHNSQMILNRHSSHFNTEDNYLFISTLRFNLLAFGTNPPLFTSLMYDCVFVAHKCVIFQYIKAWTFSYTTPLH